MIEGIVTERELLANALSQLEIVQQVHTSDANFLLVQMEDANAVYDFLKSKGTVVRNRSNVLLCEGCLRITIGTEKENKELLSQLQEFKGGKEGQS